MGHDYTTELVCFSTKSKDATPLFPVSKATLSSWLKKQSARMKTWVETNKYTGSEGTTLVVPNSKGKIECVLVGVAEEPSMYRFAHLPSLLQKGLYSIERGSVDVDLESACLGFALGAYRFERYKKKPTSSGRKLVWPKDVDRKRVNRLAAATYLVRDLVTTPANDMGPSDLERTAKQIATKHAATFRSVVGDALLDKNYPAIHAVGRASVDAPRLLDIVWGPEDAPKVTLVGKGVCFDSGGLDLKPASGMKLMKKDMGGAAHVLALGDAIMDAKLHIRLRILVAAVENVIDGNAFRPLDVIPTRKGLTVEIGNTDAEGRLVLCDCLADADDENPELVIDFATLTGAARVALGTEVPAIFANDESVAEDLLDAASVEEDPLWRLPLHRPYARFIKSSIADVDNSGSSSYGGAITAALFLDKFIRTTTPWAHIDLMAYNLDSRPGRPSGGEAMGLRATYAMLERRYGKQ